MRRKLGRDGDDADAAVNGRGLTGGDGQGTGPGEFD